MPDDADRIARELSGGNQQKVVLARWLLRECKVLLLDEPTRGVDVGAKAEIYRVIADLAREGLGVVVVSSELSELAGLCTRVLVMREGELVARSTARRRPSSSCCATPSHPPTRNPSSRGGDLMSTHRRRRDAAVAAAAEAARADPAAGVRAGRRVVALI